jgi:hypothetical protein
MRIRRRVTVLTLSALLVAACGGGGPSGWSKADRERLLSNGPTDYTDPNFRGPACFLRIAQRHFKTFNDYMTATRGSLASEGATEAGKAYINEVEDKCV